MALFFLACLILLSLFPHSSPILPSETLTSAIDILSDSGYLSMSLTLQLVSQTLIFPSPSATIFAPSDYTFINSGQPSLDLLQYHLSPLKYSLETLKSLPFGTKIPTLSFNQSLIITSSDCEDQISINNVKINESAILDFGSLSIFPIYEFFNPNFQESNPNPRGDLVCKNLIFNDTLDSEITKASSALISRGYSVMASFLDLQLRGFRGNTKLTILAPIDKVMEQFTKNFSFSSVFHGHFLPCRLSLTDLYNLDEGDRLETFSEGFNIEIRRAGDILTLNGVQVNSPDIYYSDSIAVHGLQQIITPPVEDSFALITSPQ